MVSRRIRTKDVVFLCSFVLFIVLSITFFYFLFPILSPH